MIVMVINGYPLSGKDEFIKAVSTDAGIDVEVRSTIDKCKEMALRFGWDGEKTNESRKMLSDLKKWYVDHFDGPLKDFVNDIDRLNRQKSPDFYITVSREGEEIEKFKKFCEETGQVFIYVFIRRGEEKKVYGNTSDDKVCDGPDPDLIIDNDGTLSQFHDKSLDMLYGKIMEMTTDAIYDNWKKLNSIE